ncbi:GMP synthase (glutamine-hydrolysing) [Georgenia satyanarayanai]|uniref:GMP synthase (Glutamine-hydrolysing) n=1 Tax=Georgenia satyanarayanai TaxID=860221 RepID=A0A2Y9A4I0_9MICO|nr:glutamine amidotransferase [Georgenia satyanarayanai]PYG01162.1 GMP synthase (glutamine-hydrolysing) [Georgenia satyanarayanai]SSA39401.1 GMP synthase (glutamine-hydrolysing) [Georgenia satyanarayanai]
MKPFLLISTRSEDDAADAEHASMLALGGLAEGELEWLRLESEPLPDLDLDAYSGIILGGSPFTSSVPDEHKSDTQRRVEAELSGLLDVLVERDFPFFGACYGIGTLARHIGGVLDGTYAEPISAPVITLTDEGRADPVLEGLPTSFQAFVGHKEACTHLPESAVILATSEHCPVQMFRVRTNLYGTQFHPELTLEALVERMTVYRHAGYFDPDDFDAVHREVAAADVSAAGKVLTNFVQRYAH